MLLVAAAASFPRLVIFPNSADSSMFVWMGRRMLAGDLPYRDMWDNKLPVLYWLNLLIAWTGRPNLAIWALVSLAAAAGGMMIFAIGRRFFTAAAAGLAGLTYVTLACSPAIGETGNLTEVWAAPFAILSIYAMIRLADCHRAGTVPFSGSREKGTVPLVPADTRGTVPIFVNNHENGDSPLRQCQRAAGSWAVLSGFGLATAACLRPPAGLLVIVLLALLPAIFRAGRLNLRSAGLWLAGFAVTPALIAAWALAAGVFQQMWESCVLFNISYGSGAARPEWANWGHVADSFMEIITDTWPWHAIATVGLFLLLVGPARPPRDSRNPGSPLRAGSFCVIVLAWLVAAVVSALPGLRLYPHHDYLTIAPLALLSLWAWQYVKNPFRPSALTLNVAQPPSAVSSPPPCNQGLGGRGEGSSPSPRQRLGAAIILLTAALLVSLHFSDVWKSALRQRDRRAYLGQAADYLQSAGRPGQTMFLFGWGAESDLYARLGWPCPTRHPMALFYPEIPSLGRMFAEWQDDLTRRPADWLVCTPTFNLDPPASRASSQPQSQPAGDDPFEPMRQFFRDHYQYDRSFLPPQPAEEGLMIYRLKDSLRPRPHDAGEK